MQPGDDIFRTASTKYFHALGPILCAPGLKVRPTAPLDVRLCELELIFNQQLRNFKFHNRLLFPLFDLDEAPTKKAELPDHADRAVCSFHES